ncbi:MAG: hypothetical protein EKK40_07010 [Bradyrhizobiaceae bacterium]|nr:MAG: hypothetical protein EKK40_07010 [Bradyrhizobiaceae bacterium]
MPLFMPVTIMGGGLIVNLSPPVAGDNDDGTAYGLRTLLTTSILSAPSNGSAIRVTFSASTGNNLPVTAAYVGHKGASAPNFDGNQKQLLFGGSGSVTITANSSITSDLLNFSFDKTKDLIISVGTTSLHMKTGNPSATGYTAYNKPSDQSNSGTTTVSSYSTATSEFYGCTKIEIFQ